MISAKCMTALAWSLSIKPLGHSHLKKAFFPCCFQMCHFSTTGQFSHMDFKAQHVCKLIEHVIFQLCRCKSNSVQTSAHARSQQRKPSPHKPTSVPMSEADLGQSWLMRLQPPQRFFGQVAKLHTYLWNKKTCKVKQWRQNVSTKQNWWTAWGWEPLQPQNDQNVISIFPFWLCFCWCFDTNMKTNKQPQSCVDVQGQPAARCSQDEKDANYAAGIHVPVFIDPLCSY